MPFNGEEMGIKRPLRNQFVTDSEATSERMRLVKSKGTKLEASMEEILKSMNLKAEVQPKILGKPDFRIIDTNVLIFCDSSFWHGRNPEDLSGKNFKRNKALWMDKLTKTKRRDQMVTRKLKSEGWKVLRFWDDDLLKNPEKCKNRILREIGAPRLF